MKYNQFFAELTAAGQSQDGKQVCSVKAWQTGSSDRNGT